MEEHAPSTFMLDDFYAVRLHSEGEHEVSGEVVRLAAQSGDVATHLFDVPLMQDEQAAKDWAMRALEAYREG